jgi:hypothetical protein
MTLRDTELIGKKLVKYGFSRSNTDHQNYISTSYPNVMTVHFVRYGGVWLANFVHYMDINTIVKFDSHEAVFTPQWVIKEHEKLQAMFKFARS